MASNATENISQVEEIYTHEGISSPVRVANVPRFVNPAVANVPRFWKIKKKKKRLCSAAELGLSLNYIVK